ncbi:unnamed protein product [Nezara viridula]|uniref:Elongator complex protein 5 n=1 Tax=Nezara viridula TaxID=85310 RepID=A0A9P0MT42_NEZVI|nr:unnamed protein product [Nezara viridula]
MLLKQILAGRKRSDFVIIKDNINFNGLAILKSFIEEGKARNVAIHLILSEYEVTNFDLSPNIVIHKYFPDPWRLLTINDDQKNFELMVDNIFNQSLTSGGPVLILIDSIASILNYVDLHTFCSCIRKLTTANNKDIPVAQVVTLLHSELLPEDSKEFKHLNYIATTQINLRLEPDKRTMLDLVYRQLNGKFQKETYSCQYNSTKELQYEIIKDPPKNKKPESDNILVKTTFKLTLEEKEKESRRQVILPYIKTSNKESKGRIYYEPDANDDWDDEDPDDDLEI